MAGIRSPLLLMRRAVLPAVGFLIIANFLGYAILGDNGVLAWGDYRRLKAEKAVELAELREEKARLAHRNELLDPENVDPDLGEELVRRELGLIRPDEVIIEIEEAPATVPVAAR